MTDTNGELLLNAILAIFAVVFCVALFYAHFSNGKGKYANFNILDIVRTRDGKFSRPGLAEFIAFIVMTWAFIMYVQRDTLTEAYTAIYVGAFVVRGGFASWLASKEKK